jgi:hypothetical protein
MKHLIKHELVGSLPRMDQHEAEFDQLMERSLAGDLDAQELVVDGAAHFYGLCIKDFDGSVPVLIDAIKGLEQAAQFE